MRTSTPRPSGPERDGGSGLTRRRAFVLGAGALGASVGLDRILTRAPTKTIPASRAGRSSPAAEPFFGPNQAGIATPAQEYLSFAVFDVESPEPTDLRELLEAWTAAAAELTSGRSYEPSQTHGAQPADPGEAAGLGPARLTVTIGFGPDLFSRNGHERFGIGSRRPPALRPLPPFRGEALDPGASGGDLCVQACAEDPQVAFHATHVLARTAAPSASVRWTQLGFGRTSSSSVAQKTPRNLMGFKDGTANIRAEDHVAMRSFVWVNSADGPAWMAGGTYLIARRIRILFDVWDSSTLDEQEHTIGRIKESGAPLGGRNEYDAIDLSASSAGEPVIPADAHIRLAHPRYNDGQRILRRGYSYAEGVEAGSGQINAGLFFIAFQRSPERQFIPMLRRLSATDALNQHILHTSSSIFACPPGARSGGFIGEGLFA